MYILFRVKTFGASVFKLHLFEERGREGLIYVSYCTWLFNLNLPIFMGKKYYWKKKSNKLSPNNNIIRIILKNINTVSSLNNNNIWIPPPHFPVCSLKKFFLLQNCKFSTYDPSVFSPKYTGKKWLGKECTRMLKNGMSYSLAIQGWGILKDLFGVGIIRDFPSV